MRKLCNLILVLLLLPQWTILVILTHHHPEQAVWDVPRGVAPGLGRGVGEDDGGLADGQRVSRRLHRAVRQVHDHAQTVHLLDHSLESTV